ncbi:hypothetical protein FA13DRAFT_1583509, partial [Coprinellus micaceus]
MPPQSLPNFSAEQRTLIMSSIPKFVEWLDNNNPTNAPRHKATTVWMAARARELMADPKLSINLLGGRSAALAESDIHNYFKNYKNYTYKKSIPSTAPCSSPTPTHRTATLKGRRLADALRGFIVLQTDLTAKDVFFREAADEMDATAAKVKAMSAPGTLPCTITSKARKLAWATTDKDKWAHRKTELEQNTQRNGETWPLYMREAIQQSLDRGIVGSAVVGILYGFRDQDDGLNYGMLYAGHNALENSELVHQPTSHGEILDLWKVHADAVMPSTTKPSVFDFKRDDNGFPILVGLDLAHTTGHQAADVLNAYLAETWDAGFPPSNGKPSIPWSNIALTPSAYYDLDRFKLPTSVGNPAPCDPIFAIALYDHLFRLQGAGTPFWFHAKSELDARSLAIAQDILNDLEKDDEHLDDESGS